MISFAGGKEAVLDNKLLDWPTLKASLQSFIKVCGADTDWPSRYLVYAYQFGDREAARDALEVIQGNYFPEIFGTQQITKN